MICPACGSAVDRYQWTPYNVSGKLYVACQCRCGTRWIYDKVGMVVPPQSAALDPPIAPVDVIDV